MIEFESVSKTFRDGTTAVDDLSLVVPSGKITVIVGPSGCGKTTTLRMVNRMLEPSKGKIIWDGKSIKSRRRTALRRQMGYVIQSGGLFPHRTVLENIATVPDLLRWDKQKSRKRAVELLGSVGLDRKLGQRYPAQLSGGQQQRVGVARALAADPLVLLMDEPFSAVDPVVRGELHEFFLGLQRQLSKTIIMITHDIDEAIKLGDQVAILRVGGRLAQVGNAQQLLEEPADAFVEGFVGKDRGYRSLSFQPASGLALGSVQVARDAGYAGGDGPVLVVDADARPVGWADPSRPGTAIPVGATFDPETDSLRAALDAALTSPVGLAVAVTGDPRRYAGVVDADLILRQVTRARAQIAESIAIRSQDEPGSPYAPPPAGGSTVVGASAVADAPPQSYEDPDATSVRAVPPVEAAPLVETVPPVEPVESVEAVPPVQGVESVGTVAAAGETGSGWTDDDPDATRIAAPLTDAGEPVETTPVETTPAETTPAETTPAERWADDRAVTEAPAEPYGAEAPAREEERATAYDASGQTTADAATASGEATPPAEEDHRADESAHQQPAAEQPAAEQPATEQQAADSDDHDREPPR